MIVDTHVHVVAPDESSHPLRPPGVGTQWYLEHPVSVDSFASTASAAGVQRAALVQAYGAYGTDNSYVVDAAGRDASRFVSVVVVASADERLDATLAELASCTAFGGVRVFSIGAPPPNPLDDPRTLGIWSAARELGFPLVVATLADSLPALAGILDEFPDVPVLLDHCGFAPFDALRPLARFEQLHLKVSSHVLEAAEHEGGDPRDLVGALAELYGAHRLLWGSDYPQTHDRPYEALVDLALRACERLPGADRERVTGGNARRVWPTLGG